MKTQMTIKLFEWSARIALLSLFLLGALAYFKVGGLLFLLAFVVTMFGSFLYIWYQGRLRSQGRSHPKGTDFLLDVSLSIAVMLAALFIVWRNFGLLAAAYQ